MAHGTCRVALMAALDIDGYRKYLRGRGLTARDVCAHCRCLSAASGAARKAGLDIDKLTAAGVKKLASLLLRRRMNKYGTYLAIIRYLNFRRNFTPMVALMELVDGVEVLGVLRGRIAKARGKKAADAIFRGVDVPAPGEPLSKYPPAAKKVVERMEKALPGAECRRLLSSGLHGGPYPPGEKATVRKRYSKARSIDEFLRAEHEDYVRELKAIMDSGKMYYTQPITPAVLRYVRDTPLISGVRKGNKIITIKIPYMADAYLREKSSRMRRYLYCHCPWVRGSIKAGKPKVPETFCNCSAGFTKFYFDAVFGRSVQCEVVETVLGGADVCKFAVTIPKSEMK